MNATRTSILSTLALISSLAFAQTGDIKTVPTVPLLESYWTCFDASDESNTRGQRMDEQVLNICTAVSREVQRRHFDNDFGKLHEWTKLNRAKRSTNI